MNNSNSFNICPRCGRSNSLNAKFCSSCGVQLRVPEEVVVCNRCHTRNSPMANFCRNCGSQLKVGEQVKICPKCSKELPANTNVCTCGYSFASVSVVNPQQKAVSVRENDQTNGKQQKVSKVVSKKGGKAFAIVALVFLLIFAYFTIAPLKLRPAVLENFDRGLITIDGYQMYLASYGFNATKGVIAAIKAYQGGSFVEGLLYPMGAAMGNIPMRIMYVTGVVFVLCALIHLIVCIVRAFTGKRSRKANVVYLILAILSTIVVAALYVGNMVDISKLGVLAKILVLPQGTTMGFVLIAIPVYFWFFYLYSLIAKAKPLKETVA